MEQQAGEQEQIARFAARLHALTPTVWVTPTLVVANVGLFLALLVVGQSMNPRLDTMLNWGANFAPKTLAGQWWRTVTSMFLHYGLLHVGLNMWVLWSLGRLVERMVGNIGFLLLYFVAGIGGSLASLAWNPTAVSAGASGAVFGVCGALLGFLAIRRDSIPPTVLSSLRSSMLAFIGYNVVFGLAAWGIKQAAPGAIGIDNAAHLGGLASGFLCGLLLSQPITRDTDLTRPLRNGLLAVLGSMAIGLGFWLLPPPPPDLLAELNRFGVEENRLLRHYDSLISQQRSGRLSDEEVAESIENEILPAWRQWRLQIGRLETAPLANAPALREIGRSMLLREESWEALVAAIRGQGEQAFQQHQEKWKAADAAAQQLRSQPSP